MPAKSFTPSPDEWIKLYTLSLFSNAVANRQGTEAALQQCMEDILPSEIENLDNSWALSWGPRVYKKNKLDIHNGPDNVWYAAVNESEKVVVVAVAGTSTKSLQGWVIIDFNVAQTVDFEEWTGTWTSDEIPKPTHSRPEAEPAARAAMGTCVGVWNVVSHTSSATAPGTTIGQYLETMKDYTVIFTGHSMGGAVAPLTALALRQSQIVPTNSTWYILPSAGATPGNQELIDMMTAQFPPGPLPSPPTKQYAVFNRDLYNTLDVVPQAWSLDPSSDRNVNKINQIYAGIGELAAGDVKRLVNDLAVLSRVSGIKYVPIAGVPFTQDPFDAGSIETLDDVARQAVTEHVKAYLDYFGNTDAITRFSDRLRAHPGVKGAVLQMASSAQAGEMSDGKVKLGQEAAVHSHSIGIGSNVI
ncbi:hypothetical protein PFICI_09213 [Pestalotiopsis fici W106-1]|uniref:Fungal lipase-type domain-containing protein n=1 Tax=Pestalotiopsis fici (strain W106-1 / CGMCC3.15140) TaxID=1229662 RepID=W3WZT8_PESFW|nr:uncharacterized protein PFICI_09213 [Pestalotiopsis fici W106-1]ETS79360.1 hypothetical protein PFICI_09213 [Pestalotiopsis fici W106-1]